MVALALIKTRERIRKLNDLKQSALCQVQKGFVGKTRVQITTITGLADSEISKLKLGKIDSMTLDWLIMITIAFGFEAKIGFTG